MVSIDYFKVDPEEARALDTHKVITLIVCFNVDSKGSTSA